MPPKKTTIDKTSREIYALCTCDAVIGCNIELAFPATSELNFVKAVCDAGKLHVLHEFMLASDTEIELDELQDMDAEELTSVVLTWIAENRPNYSLVSFKLG